MKKGGRKTVFAYKIMTLNEKKAPVKRSASSCGNTNGVSVILIYWVQRICRCYWVSCVLNIWGQSLGAVRKTKMVRIEKKNIEL